MNYFPCRLSLASKFKGDMDFNMEASLGYFLEGFGVGNPLPERFLLSSE